MTAAAIELTQVSVCYQQKPVLEDVTVTVPSGVICGLVGMNGAGKSTLFRAIMHAVPLIRGRVRLYGHTVKTAQRRGMVAYVPQTEVIDWEFPVSVRDVVLMGRYQYMGILRRPAAADLAAVDEALARVHLSEYADRQIGQLSGGQKKRVFVARALAQGASLLLLDEPFAGVDVKTEAALIALLKELRDQGVTMLLATHDLATIGSYCDHMILLKQTVVAAGPTAQVFTPALIAATYDSTEGSMPWISC